MNSTWEIECNNLYVDNNIDINIQVMLSNYGLDFLILALIIARIIITW